MSTRFKTAAALIVALTLGGQAQAQKGDSVVVNVGKESRVTFMIKDKEDLATLKQYNFQAVVDDLVKKLENRDSTASTKAPSEFLKDSSTTISTGQAETWDHDRDRDEDDWYSHRHGKRWDRRTYHSFNVDIGMNNYLQDGHFPDANNSLYTVKPWGSWYVGLNSVLRTRVSGKFFIEWGGGVSWYNFKFENEKVTITKDDTGVIFSEDTRDLDFQKSKLTAAYVNVSMIPMIDFGGYGRKPMMFDGDRMNFDKRGSFRFGVGPYVGYRIDSYSKQMYMDGDKEKEHNHDNFYMENMRYGLRLQLGFRDTDIFFNYDMNELFSEGKGPKLNAFSFGVTL